MLRGATDNFEDTRLAYINLYTDSADIITEDLNGISGGRGITLDPAKNIYYISNGSKTIARVDANTLQKVSEFNVHHSENYE